MNIFCYLLADCLKNDNFFLKNRADQILPLPVQVLSVQMICFNVVWNHIICVVRNERPYGNPVILSFPDISKTSFCPGYVENVYISSLMDSIRFLCGGSIRSRREFCHVTCRANMRFNESLKDFEGVSFWVISQTVDEWFCFDCAAPQGVTKEMS